MRYRIVTNFSLCYKNTNSSILIIIKILRFKVANVKTSHSNQRILTKRNISKTELTQNTLIQQYSTLAPKQETTHRSNDRRLPRQVEIWRNPCFASADLEKREHAANARLSSPFVRRRLVNGAQNGVGEARSQSRD